MTIIIHMRMGELLTDTALVITALCLLNRGVLDIPPAKIEGRARKLYIDLTGFAGTIKGIAAKLHNDIVAIGAVVCLRSEPRAHYIRNDTGCNPGKFQGIISHSVYLLKYKLQCC